MAAAEIPLPEPVIQRVQYFLTSKEAARTSILSKSWGSAWLTRPNLDFDQEDFPGRRCDLFSMFADKTLKRYEDSNLKIESFKLRVYILWSYGGEHRTENLIARALKLGASSLTCNTDTCDFVLPKEVYASENLVELTLEYCEIDLGLNQDDVRWCSRLQSLSLERVQIKSLDTLLHIISSCHLIEKLSLSQIYDSSDDGGGGVIGEYGYGTHDLITLPRLRSLALIYVEIDTLFFRGLSSNFPSLKDLTLLKYTSGFKEDGQDNIEEVLISSPSLECLHLKTEVKYIWRYKFDVPSIRKFTYESRYIPSVSFRSTSRAWESHVDITRYKCLTASWFRRLSKFLTKLRRSTIYVSICACSYKSFHYVVGDIQGLSTRMIENLTIDLASMPSLSRYALLDGVFLFCRPKWITPLNNIDFIGQALLQGLEVQFSTPKQFMYGLKDLKEATAQVFDSDVSSWRDVPLDAFLKNSTTPAKEKRDVRFELKW